MQPGSQAYTSQMNAMTGFFKGMTGNTADARNMAQANLYQQLNQQASVMGYQDIYRVLCWMSVILIAFGFLLSKNRPGQGAPAGEAVH